MDDLYILPIGFKKPLSPIDFLTNKTEIEKSSKFVKEFIQQIQSEIQDLDVNGIEETVMVPFSILYKNEKRLKNADIVAAINNNKQVNISIREEVQISNNPDAKSVKIKEDVLINDIYTEQYSDIFTYCKGHFQNWKLNKGFHAIMKKLKRNAMLCYERMLDPNNPKTTKKAYYSKDIYEELKKYYDEN